MTLLSAPRRFVPLLLALLLSLTCALVAMAADDSKNPPNLKGYVVTPFQISDLMGQGEDNCMEHHWNPGVQDICCLGDDPTSPNKCKLLFKGSQYFIDYWEPSAMIEVSCRTGYSILTPGKIAARASSAAGAGKGGKTASGSEAASPQSCLGFNQPGNSHWFFEARVWAINGQDGGLRHQAMGGTAGQKVQQCSEYSDPGDTIKGDYWGYGKQKWGKFSHSGAGSGPGGSWEAYISDKDPAWVGLKEDWKTVAKGDISKFSGNMQECKPNSPDVNNCWGPMSPTGHVTHPNPTVAAALVAWRAHQKALDAGKVSPDLGGGWKMAMDFPFPTYTGAHAGSMGAKGGGDKTGSECFKPGDPGPKWYNGQEPTAVTSYIKGLKPGDVKATADMNSGVYVFTIWVKTKCTRWVVNPKGPAGVCVYADTSP